MVDVRSGTDMEGYQSRSARALGGLVSVDGAESGSLG